MLLRERSIERREFLYKEPGRSYLHARTLADKPQRRRSLARRRHLKRLIVVSAWRPQAAARVKADPSTPALGSRGPLERD